jgi:hypothetical protein
MHRLYLSKWGALEPNGFKDGYGISNAYILIPAFRAAVEGKTVKEMKNPKKAGLPIPNWKITYSGLKISRSSTDSSPSLIFCILIRRLIQQQEFSRVSITSTVLILTMQRREILMMIISIRSLLLR